ncbi:MAG: glycosyltransferase family 4 protein [Chloroflexi bacterium]|nr:glycosyltransferase family 4 protein [Chloroflexota bacterium]
MCYARGRDYLAPLIALALGRRVIFEVHGLPASPREESALRRIAASPRGRLVAISSKLSERYANLQSPISELLIAPDGVDLRRFTPPLGHHEARRMCALPLDRPLVVYVGGLYAGRGLEELIAAMGRAVETLHATSLPPQLVIVGGRDESEIARFRALAQDCQTQATFVGYRPPTEIPKYLFAADVLAMPYAARVETPGGEDTAAWMSPLKMFEYLAAGRPIVATDLPALREVLTHESNALLAAPGSTESLRHQIERVLTDTSLAARLSQQARADAGAYSWERRAERILNSLQ